MAHNYYHNSEQLWLITMAQPLTIITKRSILDVVAVLDPPLTTWVNAKESDEVQIPIETNKDSIKVDPYA